MPLDRGRPRAARGPAREIARRGRASHAAPIAAGPRRGVAVLRATARRASRPARRPVPAVASAALPVGLIDGERGPARRSRVPEPLSTTTQPSRSRQRVRAAQPVGLHLAPSSRPSRRAASSGCGVSTVAWPRDARARSCACSDGVGGDRVQRIGVEHEAPAQAEQARQHGAHASPPPQPQTTVAAASASDAPRHQRAAEHQFGPQRVERSCALSVEQAARTRARRRPHARRARPAAPRRPCRARRRRSATSPKLPLCCAWRRGARRAPASAPASQRVGGVAGGVDAEVVEPDRARRGRGPAPVKRPGFERQQRQRVVGAHAGVAERPAGVGVQAGRQVDRQHRAGQGVELRDRVRPARPRARGWRPMPSSASIARSCASSGAAQRRRRCARRQRARVPARRPHRPAAAPASPSEHELDTCCPARCRCTAASKPSPPLLPGPAAIHTRSCMRRERQREAAPPPRRRGASACAAAAPPARALLDRARGRGTVQRQVVRGADTRQEAAWRWASRDLPHWRGRADCASLPALDSNLDQGAAPDEIRCSGRGRRPPSPWSAQRPGAAVLPHRHRRHRRHLLPGGRHDRQRGRRSRARSSSPRRPATARWPTSTASPAARWSRASRRPTWPPGRRRAPASTKASPTCRACA